MYIVYKCYDYDCDSKLNYNVNSLIGIYDNIFQARNDLLDKLKKNKCEIEIEFDDETYFFCHIISKNGKEITSSKRTCYEIIDRKIDFNEIRMTNK